MKQPAIMNEKDYIANNIQRIFESDPTGNEIQPRSAASEKWKRIGPLNATKMISDGHLQI